MAFRMEQAAVPGFAFLAMILILPFSSSCGRGREPASHTGTENLTMTDEPDPGKKDPGTAGSIPATDSGAAATAMATGRKTTRGRISWAADRADGPLVNLGDILPSEGISLGLVTTVPFSHATPACFAAHNAGRHHYYRGRSGIDTPGISEEMLFSGRVSLIIGAGHPSWDNPRWATDEGYLSRESFIQLRTGAPGLVFVERERGADGADLLMEACSADPDSGIMIVGLFGGEEGCFEPPVPTDDGSGAVNPANQENPTLGEAVSAALDFLAADDQGFLLVLEQGDIDWANHDNDYRWLMGAMWDLENAVLAVTAFVDSCPLLDWDDTMIILTADHSNGYMRLAGDQHMGIGELPEQLGEPGDFIYPGGEVSYSHTGHTNELVSFRARFPERMTSLLDSLEGTPPAPGNGLLDNTHIHHIITSAFRMEEPVSHIILVIGDGMDPEQERAAGLYLHGSDTGMAWHDTTLFPYSNWCTTWDVDTYDLYASAADEEPFSEGRMDPALGYDPSRGGANPGEGSAEYFLTPIVAPSR